MKRKAKNALSQGQIAAILGVTREHLNRVLQGHRESRRLMAAYRSLMASLPNSETKGGRSDKGGK